MDFAWHSAQQQLQMLRIQPDEARRFQQLASHLLFPNTLLRASARRLERQPQGAGRPVAVRHLGRSAPCPDHHR